MTDSSIQKGRAPVQVLAIVGGAVAIAFVVAAGTGLASVLPDPSPWLKAAAYLAPAGLAFAAYWWIAQKV